MCLERTISRKSGKGKLYIAGFLLSASGTGLLLVCAGLLVQRLVISRSVLHDFDQAQAELGRTRAVQLIDGRAESQHSAVPIKAEKKVLPKGVLPLAVIKFPQQNLRVPVFEGTGELTLNTGAGWIEGTARPGEEGNIGIAGHRDSFFEVLKDAKVGDVIELSTLEETYTYIVDQLETVDPTDVAVLGPRPSPSLTLVTCYPFHFIGPAPQRFIVHAAFSAKAGAAVLEISKNDSPQVIEKIVKENREK
jgi:sortase A